MDSYVYVIGYLAAILTTVSTLPQFISTVKTKNVEGVSLWMFITLGSGIVLWLIYGLLNNDFPLIFANSVTFLFVLANIIMIIKYKK